MTYRKRLSPVLWVGLGLVSMVLAGCQREPPVEEVPRPVRTLVVEPGSPEGERVLPGRLEASANRRLSFRLAGRLEGYTVRVGELVNVGQPLARLEETDVRLQHDQAQAGLAAATAAATNAEAEWVRARRLYEAGSVPVRQLDAARAQRDSARAQQRSAERQLDLAQRQVGFTTLDAPGECRVAQRLAEAGENVAAGQPVLVLACGETLEVRAALPEDLLARVAEGDRVEVALPLADTSVTGKVTEIGLPLQPPAATWPLRVTLDLAPEQRVLGTLRPGMAAEIHLPQGGVEMAALWVPMSAVGQDAEGHYVYVARQEASAEQDANGRLLARVERRAVQLGRRQGESLEISDGLEAGDLVVVAGMSRIRDAQRVRLEAQP